MVVKSNLSREFDEDRVVSILEESLILFPSHEILLTQEDSHLQEVT
jgi:hypothetical protein